MNNDSPSKLRNFKTLSKIPRLSLTTANTSFEITDIPLIDYIASKEKPIILSTGIAEKSDIELALKTIRNKNHQCSFLWTVSVIFGFFKIVVSQQ